MMTEHFEELELECLGTLDEVTRGHKGSPPDAFDGQLPF